MNQSMEKEKTNKPRLSFRDLQYKIEDFREKRDDLNKKTKEYINTLQEIDSEINDSLRVARDIYKKKRNYWNLKVKKLKEKKNEYLNLLDNFIKEKKKILKTKGSNKGHKQIISIKQLERKIENLERIIETENLDITEENAIVDKIRDLEEKKQEQLLERKSDDLYKLERKIEIVKINLNKIYEQLNKWYEKSQTNHTKMMEIYGKVNELREDKKKIEDELIENKKIADRYHEKFLQLMNQKKKMNNNRGRSKRPYKPKKKPQQRPKHKPSTIDVKLIEKMKQDKLAVALEKQKAGKKLNLFEARLILEQPKG